MIAEFFERNGKDLHLICAFFTVVIPIVLYYKDSFGIMEDGPIFAIIQIVLVLATIYTGKVNVELNYKNEGSVNSLYPPKKEDKK
jgi:1-acyl-sn-glycerol-3-phosphate acyltransferase